MWTFLIMWGPWILRIISAGSTLAGLAQGIQITQPGYLATPSNLSAIAAWIITAVGTGIGSFFAGPTGWNQVKKALDVVFKFINSKIDPENKTDVDDRILGYLEDQVLTILQKLVARWTTSEEAQKALATLRLCCALDKSGAPPKESFEAIANAATAGFSKSKPKG